MGEGFINPIVSWTELLFEEFLELSDDYFSLAFYGFFLNCENERELADIGTQNYDEIKRLVGDEGELEA